MEWIKAKNTLPDEEGEIMFITQDNLTDERIGIAIPDQKLVLLKRTEILYSQLRYWFYIPSIPKEYKDEMDKR